MKKFKKFVCAVLVAAVSACAVPTYQADAASISQLQQKRQNLASSTKKAKQEIANIKNKKLSAEQEMEAMDKVLTSIQAELDEATEDLNILTKQLEEAEKALQEATEKRDAQFALLGSRMRFLQQKGSSGYLEILFDAQSFSDLFLRMQYVNDIMGYDKEILEELEETQRTIEKKKKEIEKNKAEQEEVVKLQKEKLAEQQEIVNEKKALVASYQNDLSKYEQMVAANEKADKAVLNQIAKQQQQSRAAAAALRYIIPETALWVGLFPGVPLSAAALSLVLARLPVEQNPTAVWIFLHLMVQRLLRQRRVRLHIPAG